MNLQPALKTSSLCTDPHTIPTGVPTYSRWLRIPMNGGEFEYRAGPISTAHYFCALNLFAPAWN
jgi:hypothetical protein